MLRQSLSLPGKWSILPVTAQRLWDLRWLFLMNVYLLSPILVYDFRWTEGGPEKATLFLLASSCLWLLLVQAVGRRACLTHALLFPFYVTVGVDLFVIFVYRTRLSSSMLLVMYDNLSDATGFLKEFALPVAITVAVLLTVYGLALWKVRHVALRVPPRALLPLLLALLAVYGVSFMRASTLMRLAAADRGSPFGIVPQSYVSYSVAQATLAAAQQARNFRFNATRANPPKEPEVHVLVIGESARPDHFGLYGYSRSTNPRLLKTDNLIVFRDVLSQTALTKDAVPLLLTRGNIRNLEETRGESSVVSLFREVGFHTLWYSTQQRDPTTGNINRYSSEADEQRFVDRRHDGVLVQMLRDRLAQSDNATAKLFVVLHTQGSHFTYRSRYPESFTVFPDTGVSDHDQLINSYDNTVAYTDQVVYELITLLKGRPGIKTLSFWGDHGENLEDDARKLRLHMMNNEYDLPIPAFFWYSPEFAARSPALLQAARLNAQKRASSRAAFYSLAAIAGIEFGDSRLGQLSLFSPSFALGPRLVQGPDGPRDFDIWRKSLP